MCPSPHPKTWIQPKYRARQSRLLGPVGGGPILFNCFIIRTISGKYIYVIYENSIYDCLIMRYEQLQKTSLYRDLLFSRNRMLHDDEDWYTFCSSVNILVLKETLISHISRFFYRIYDQ